MTRPGPEPLSNRLVAWLLCSWLGHRWTDWISRGQTTRERCGRCLRWRDG